MEKVAIIEMSAKALKLIFINVQDNLYFNIFDEISEPSKLGEDIKDDNLIHPAIANECLDVLKLFRNVCDSNGVTKVTAIVQSFIKEAKNKNSLFDEIYNNTGFNFSIVEKEDEIKAIYTAVINSVDVPKGILINVGDTETTILSYNRRNILACHNITIGALNLLERFDTESQKANKIYDEMQKIIKSELDKIDFLKNIDSEIAFVGSGKVFTSAAELARKISRYPLDIENNYILSQENFESVFGFIREYGFDKSKKIKGFSDYSVEKLSSGFSILKAIFDYVNFNAITICSKDFIDGIIYNQIVPATSDKPVSDMLSYSLENTRAFYDRQGSNTAQVYMLSLLLFKQLRVIHKLQRQYAKPLRIAASMYDCGIRLNFEKNTKHSFEVILNSSLNGVSHKDLLISAFTCLCQDIDNFSLGDWIKYKDLLDEEDLDAVKKMGTIIKLADYLDKSRRSVMTDINCDILGDSVIMKTVTSGNAKFEILQAQKIAPTFKKIFGKNLQVI